MLVTPFDFDVISGPSLPRDDRTQAAEPAAREQPQGSAPPAQPRSK